MLVNFSCFLILSFADFFKINFYKKFFQEDYQSVKCPVGPDLNQNHSQSYQKTTKITASKERFNTNNYSATIMSEIRKE